MSDPSEGTPPLTNPNSQLTIGVSKELMNKLESNINARIDRKIDEVKSDIGQIKPQLERMNDNFDDIDTRISNVEDRVEDFTQVTSDLNKFKEQWNTILSEIDKEACRACKNNIIFQGIPGGDSDPKKALNTFMTLCTETLKLPKEWTEEVDINKLYRFPPKGGKGSWPLFLNLAKSRQSRSVPSSS